MSRLICPTDEKGVSRCVARVTRPWFWARSMGGLPMPRGRRRHAEGGVDPKGCRERTLRRTASPDPSSLRSLGMTRGASSEDTTGRVPWDWGLRGQGASGVGGLARRGGRRGEGLRLAEVARGFGDAGGQGDRVAEDRDEQQGKGDREGEDQQGERGDAAAFGAAVAPGELVGGERGGEVAEFFGRERLCGAAAEGFEGEEGGDEEGGFLAGEDLDVDCLAVRGFVDSLDVGREGEVGHAGARHVVGDGAGAVGGELDGVFWEMGEGEIGVEVVERWMGAGGGGVPGHLGREFGEALGRGGGAFEADFGEDDAHGGW
jgi:hypothetical protein